MIKTQGKSSITISKTAFLDEMLPAPRLIYHDEDLDWPILEDTDKLLELVKKLAAKVLTEQELVNILGDCHGYGRNGISYSPSKEGEKESIEKYVNQISKRTGFNRDKEAKRIRKPLEKYVQDLRNTADISDFTN